MELRIGTRGSPLALAQAHEVRDRLMGIRPDLRTEIVVLKTTGDNIQNRALAEIGGKGLFTKELDEALLDGRIHVAVHSMKDVPTWLPDGLALGCMMEREDPRDAFLSPRADSLDSLPEGAVVGTASLRRQAQILARRPDVRVTLFRGNVQTRLRKLEEGEVDATLLAMAGLNRLGMAHVATAPLTPEVMLPAVGQGAVGIAHRVDDGAVIDLLSTIHHADTATRVIAERAFLEVLDGSCRTPIAGFAEILADGSLRLRGLVAEPDGTQVRRHELTGPADQAQALGVRAGEAIRDAAR